MKSLCSTFIGICFPHSIEFQENDDAYMLLYENRLGRYSVKVITSMSILMDAFCEYNANYTAGGLRDEKQPLMISVSGEMEQVRLGNDYHGEMVEEKFHLRAFLISVIPCNPYIPESLTDLVHPQVSPQRFTGDNNSLFDYIVVLDPNYTGPAHTTEPARDRGDNEDIFGDEGNAASDHEDGPTALDDDEEIPDIFGSLNGQNRTQNMHDDEEQDPEDFFLNRAFDLNYRNANTTPAATTRSTVTTEPTTTRGSTSVRSDNSRREEPASARVPTFNGIDPMADDGWGDSYTFHLPLNNNVEFRSPTPEASLPTIEKNVTEDANMNSASCTPSSLRHSNPSGINSLSPTISSRSFSMSGENESNAMSPRSSSVMSIPESLESSSAGQFRTTGLKRHVSFMDLDEPAFGSTDIDEEIEKPLVK